MSAEETRIDQLLGAVSAAPTTETLDGPAALSAFLAGIAEQLDDETRDGADVDEPEGARFIRVSETAATRLAVSLRVASRLADPFALPDEAFYEFSCAIAEDLRRRREKQSAHQATRLSFDTLVPIRRELDPNLNCMRCGHPLTVCTCARLVTRNRA